MMIGDFFFPPTVLDIWGFLQRGRPSVVEVGGVAFVGLLATERPRYGKYEFRAPGRNAGLEVGI